MAKMTYTAACSTGEGTVEFGAFQTWNEAKAAAIAWRDRTSGPRMVIIYRYRDGAVDHKRIFTLS